MKNPAGKMHIVMKKSLHEFNYLFEKLNYIKIKFCLKEKVGVGEFKQELKFFLKNKKNI